MRQKCYQRNHLFYFAPNERNLHFLSRFTVLSVCLVYVINENIEMEALDGEHINTSSLKAVVKAEG
jgi:hypothetical protein